MLVAGVVVIVVAWGTMPLWNTQVRNLASVEEWIEKNSGAIDNFKRAENVDFELFSYTGGDGMVGVRIDPPHHFQWPEIRGFLLLLDPPRGIQALVPGIEDSLTYEVHRIAIPGSVSKAEDQRN